MVDAVHSTIVSSPMTITQSRTSWGFELGRQGLRVTRTRDARTVGRRYDAVGTSPPARKLLWPLAIGTFVSVSTFGLVVVGAFASKPVLFGQQPRYLLSVPVPALAARHMAGISYRRIKSRSAALSSLSVSSNGLVSGDRFGAEDEPYVIKAMRMGELQEWVGTDNRLRFLTAGPAQIEDGRVCRELAMLVRQPDGGTETHSAHRCATGQLYRGLPIDRGSVAEAQQDAGIKSTMNDSSSQEARDFRTETTLSSGSGAHLAPDIATDRQ